MGVDFGPYLQRVLQNVRENWYRLIPESAQMKKGKTGARVRHHERWLGARAVDNAGFRRCYAGSAGVWKHHRVGSFPPLPAEFKGEFLSLRFRFYYNPDKGEMEQ